MSFLTAGSHGSTPLAANQSDREAPTHPYRKTLSGRQKARYIQDTASSLDLLSHKRRQKHKNTLAMRGPTFLICDFCAFCGSFQQTQNVGEVVGPNHVSLHATPTIVLCDRTQLGIVARHYYPN